MPVKAMRTRQTSREARQNSDTRDKAQDPRGVACQVATEPCWALRARAQRGGSGIAFLVYQDAEPFLCSSRVSLPRRVPKLLSV